MIDYKHTKRAADIFCAISSIAVLSPLMALIFISNAIDQEGKPIFVQKRVGKNGQVFPIYKFRSMKNVSENKKDIVTISQRKTVFGDFLRKTGLDELPQLFNITKGEMSFVGPRPYPLQENDRLNVLPLRQNVRPGLFSKSYADGISAQPNWDNTLESEALYVQTISFKEDIRIIFGCLKNMFLYGHDHRDLKEQERLTDKKSPRFPNFFKNI